MKHKIEITDADGGIKRFIRGLFAVIGLLCVIFPGPIMAGLPYVLGGTMAVAGVLYGAAYFQHHGTQTDHSAELANGFVLLTLGIVFIIHGAKSIGPMGTAWAMVGIRKASKSLSQAIQAIGAKTPSLGLFIEFLVRLTFSVMLLLYPAEKFEGHIILLGLDLIAVSIRLTKRCLPALDEDE